MHKYVIKRLIMLIPVVIGVSFLVFFIMSLAPGDTARTILGEDAPIEAIEALNEELGLNDPVLALHGWACPRRPGHFLQIRTFCFH